MDLFLVCLLAIVGVLLMVLELFFIPGVGFAGIASVGVCAGAVALAYVRISPLAGHLTLLLSLLALAVLIAFFLRSRTLDKMSLKTDISDKVDLTSSLHIEIGDKLQTCSRLAPMGKVIADGQEVEAKSLGEFIDPDTTVEVVRVEGNTIVVKRAL
ncbi:MAG: hypothetical protein MJZ89_04655 [Paludibacteraceae bacterium]|nr:hypothetical protein [Paludibacteraceae bacterium]